MWSVNAVGKEATSWKNVFCWLNKCCTSHLFLVSFQSFKMYQMDFLLYLLVNHSRSKGHHHQPVRSQMHLAQGQHQPVWVAYSQEYLTCLWLQWTPFSHLWVWVVLRFYSGASKTMMVTSSRSYCSVLISGKLQVSLVLITIERFSNDYRKTKTKAIIPTNHNRNKQHDGPITIHSNYLLLAQRAGKITRTWCEWFWFYFSLVEKLARVFLANHITTFDSHLKTALTEMHRH